jgi:DNA-binding MarR family transcriptional regulator
LQSEPPPNPAEAHETAKSASPSSGDLVAFSEFILGMSRLLFGLGNLSPFQKSGLSLADWIALSLLARQPSRNNRQLAKLLGVSRQRANQIKTSLEKAEMISSVQSEVDARQSLITITQKGRAQLDLIDKELTNALDVSLPHPNRVLARGNRVLKSLTRVVRERTNSPAEALHARRNRVRRTRRRRKSQTDDGLLVS